MHESIYTIQGCPAFLALLSDLHNGDPTPVIRSLRSHHPSLICVTGDVIYGSQPKGNLSPLMTQPKALVFLKSCASMAPTYMSLGNHEWMLDEDDIREIEKTGVTVLDNTWRTIQIEGRNIVVAGLTSGYLTEYRAFRASQDWTVRYPKNDNLVGVRWAAARHEPNVSWIDEYSSVPGYHILLCHHPEYWPLIKEKKIEMVLSGHAHGGQWRFFGQGLFGPGQGFLPRWTKGVYDGKLIVSAGLSNTLWIPRIGNPVEVVYIERS